LPQDLGFEKYREEIVMEIFGNEKLRQNKTVEIFEKREGRG